MDAEAVRDFPDEPESRQVLRAPTVIFVEGADEERFVYHLLKARSPELRVFGTNVGAMVSTTERDQLAAGNLDVQIVDAGGQAGIDDLIALPVTPGFVDVTRIVVIWDAEEDASSAFTNIRDVFASYSANDETSVPSVSWVEATDASRAVAVAIMPDGIANGSLENFVLQVLESNEDDRGVWSCIDDFLACAARTAGGGERLTTAQAAKRRINAWLSVNKPLGLRLGASFDPRHGLVPLMDPSFDAIYRAVAPSESP